MSQEDMCRMHDLIYNLSFQMRHQNLEGTVESALAEIILIMSKRISELEHRVSILELEDEE